MGRKRNGTKPRAGQAWWGRAVLDETGGEERVRRSRSYLTTGGGDTRYGLRLRIIPDRSLFDLSTVAVFISSNVFIVNLGSPGVDSPLVRYIFYQRSSNFYRGLHHRIRIEYPQTLRGNPPPAPNSITSVKRRALLSELVTITVTLRLHR